MTREILDNTMHVELWIYDLSEGLASCLSASLLGMHLEGIWHTSVVVYDLEIYFGMGIEVVGKGNSPYRIPTEKLLMGRTEIPLQVLNDYLIELKSVWTAEKYHLLENNCNHFSEDLMQFLLGKSIPSHITALPAQFASSPFGSSIVPLINGMFSMSGRITKDSKSNAVQEYLKSPLIFKDDYHFKDNFNHCLDIAQKYNLVNDGIKWQRIKNLIWTDSMDENLNIWIRSIHLNELEPFINLKIQIDTRVTKSSLYLLEISRQNLPCAVMKSLVKWVKNRLLN